MLGYEMPPNAVQAAWLHAPTAGGSGIAAALGAGGMAG